jgi:TolB protein
MSEPVRTPRRIHPVIAFALVSLLAALAAVPPWGHHAASQVSDAPPPEGTESADEALPASTVVIDVDSPERALYRIAIPNVLGDATLGPEGAEVVRNDLHLISLFDVLDPRGFVADLESEGLEITPPNWAVVGAQAVVKGRIERTASGIRVEMRLYELSHGATATLTRTYSGAPGELRGFMHDFANEVVRVLTGTAGAFGTRITFARRVREGRKDVYVASFDGHSVSRISSGRGVAMLPAFGPSGLWYSMLTETGMFITRSNLTPEESPVIDAPDSINMGISICGGRAYFTSTRDGNSEIYSSALDGTDVRRLTDHPGIDVSPTCGGPGGLIAFVSNRHGSPQIFVMNSSGGGVRRITFRGSYNQTPAWCPVGSRNLLAFTGRSAGLDVFTVDIATQQYTRITQGMGVNKDPAWSPDCRMLAFYSTRGGIYMSSPEGLNQNLIVPGVAETLRWSR